MTDKEIEKLVEDMKRCQNQVRETTNTLDNLLNKKSQMPETEFLFQFEKILKQREIINSEFDEIREKFLTLDPKDFE